MSHTNGLLLPRELWKLIGDYLENVDLWRLSICSKKLRVFLSSNRWSGRLWRCNNWEALTNNAIDVTNIRVGYIGNQRYYQRIFLDYPRVEKRSRT